LAHGREVDTFFFLITFTFYMLLLRRNFEFLLHKTVN